METIRAYYWHARVRSAPIRFLRRILKGRDAYWRDFSVGNAGDIFAQNLVQHFYPGTELQNTTSGPRLLCVGSIAHKAQAGDVICGIGFKETESFTADPQSVFVQGVRGPLTRDWLKKHGIDVSTIKFFGDPGLTISDMVRPKAATLGKAIFIPHYRERGLVRPTIPAGISMVDIDSDPLRLAEKIMEAEVVYASSLHGIIFAHALGRPVVPVKPATVEPRSKFDDYFLGVGLQEPVFIDSIAEADFAKAPTSPCTLSVKPEDIVFPAASDLRERGIIT